MSNEDKAIGIIQIGFRTNFKIEQKSISIQNKVTKKWKDAELQKLSSRVQKTIYTIREKLTYINTTSQIKLEAIKGACRSKERSYEKYTHKQTLRLK